MARRWGRRSSWGWSDWERRVPDPPPSRAELKAELGRAPSPVQAEGRELSCTVWGRAWCENLERYQDYAHRLQRGRTYLRQGAVLDLAIERGRITALVMGTSLYRVSIRVAAVDRARWSALRRHCEGRLSSLIELLEGRVGDDVMAAVTERKGGLFPEPREIELSCSCPDWATMCKHVAAVLYGVGVRLDAQPRLLFELRGVDPAQMIGAPKRVIGPPEGGRRLDGGLSEIFGVAIEESTPPIGRARASARAVTKATKAASKPVAARATKAASKPVAARATKTASKPVAATPVLQPTAKAPTAARAPGAARRRASDVLMTRRQLLAKGLPASTLQGWLRRRVLVPTPEPGVYVLTDEARECLAWYG